MFPPYCVPGPGPRSTWERFIPLQRVIVGDLRKKSQCFGGNGVFFYFMVEIGNFCYN